MLGPLALGIDVGVVRVRLVLLLGLLLGQRVGVFLLAREESYELFQRLIVEGVAEVLAHALEAAEAPLAPLRVVADVGIAVFVQLISVGGEDGRHGEGVALGQLQTQARGQIAPGALLRRHIIREGGAQFVDERDFAEARRVAVGTDLHLYVVGDVHRHHTRLARRRRTVDAAAVGAVGHSLHFSPGVGARVGLIHAPERRGEVGGVREADRRGEDVAHGLDLLAHESQRGPVEAIELRIHGEIHGEVVHVVEAVERVALDGLLVAVPRLHHLVGVHAVGEVE